MHKSIKNAAAVSVCMLLGACASTAPGPHQTPLPGPPPVEKQVVVPQMEETEQLAELERLEAESPSRTSPSRAYRFVPTDGFRSHWSATWRLPAARSVN
jgi:hypothetical protein